MGWQYELVNNGNNLNMQCITCCGNVIQNTLCVCGTFAEPENPDQGQCASYRVKKDCEAPDVPVLTEMSYDPDDDPPFTII